MLVPLYGFLQGDTIGLLILMQDYETVQQLGARLQQAAAVRAPPRPRANVYFNGRLLEPKLTVAEAGLSALDRIEVVQQDD